MSFPANKKITEPFDYLFHVSENGVYAIAISARCRSGEQTGKRGGEDLRLKIDGRTFREVPAVSKHQYQDTPASWNGTHLKGLKQTVMFILHLKAGGHAITFIPQEGAVIENEPHISLIKDLANVEFNPEEQAEDGDRRPWFTFALIDLPLQSFSIDASAKWHLEDSDDIKLIVDGEVQKNTSILAILRRDWLWAGSIIKKLFQNERQQKTFTPSLPHSTHYIELWTDRMPTLHSAKFNISRADSSLKAKVVWEETVLRTEPNTTAMILGHRIAHGERVTILEKAIAGERVKTPSGVLLPTDRWHKVKYKNKDGYVYSLALEIEGEDKETIQKIIIAEARAVGINPEILMALADCESNTFPYTVSWQEKEPNVEVAFGVMQLTKKLIIDLNNPSKPFYNPIDIDHVFDIKQNVRGGVRYFHFLYDTHYKSAVDRLRKSVAAYNTGYGNVPLGGHLDLKDYSGETKRIVPCVEKHLRNKTFQKIISRVKATASIVLVLVLALYLHEEIAGQRLGILPDKQSASVIQAEQEFRTPNKFPAVVLHENGKELSFFNRNGKQIKRMPVDRLDTLAELLTTGNNYFFISRGVLEFPDNTFYFLASVSSLCKTTIGYGDNNCAYLLYRFDADRDELSLIRKDIWGTDYDLYISPDASRLAIVRDVMTSICTIDSYLTILNLHTLDKKEYDVIGERKYFNVNSIRSLHWQDEKKIVLDIYRYDQEGCDPYQHPKPPREEIKTITVHSTTVK